MPENCAAIVIAAKHHELIKVKDARGTTNTIGALRCKFQFRTDDWLHSAKTAMFCNGDAVLHPEVINDAIAVPLDADDECPVPYEVLTDTLPYSVGVWGVTPKGLRVVSNWLVFNAQVGCYTEGNAPEDPEQTIYEEILLIANEAVNAVKDVTQRADSGEFEGKSAYELAVDDGFEGTKSEWLASLVGTPGQDGYTPVKGVDYVDGKDGKDGADGVSATHSWNGTTLTITSASGTSSVDLKGEKGNTGDAGYTPQKTIDYWTDDDKKEIEGYIDSAIANIDIPDSVDLSIYATKEEVEKQVEDAKEFMHQMDNMLANNLTEDIDRLYASKDYVDDAIANIDIPEGGLPGMPEDGFGYIQYDNGSYSLTQGQLLTEPRPSYENFIIQQTNGYWDAVSVSDALTNAGVEIGGGGPKNILDSESKGGVHQIADNVAEGFDFTGKNANATSYDASLTGTIPYGATGDFASAFGGKSAAIGKRSHAEGTTTIAKGAYSHAEGDNSVTLGADSHAEGYKTTAYAEGSHAEGGNTVTKGKYSHAEGENTITAGHASHAEGYGSSTGSSAGEHEGDVSAAHAEGYENHANGRGAHAEGVHSTAFAEGAHAEGYQTLANGLAAHAEGAASYASGESAHAEGNHTIAQGTFSHTEGNNTYAGVNETGGFFGESAHAEGENTHAYGYASHTEGIGTEAYGEAQHVQGRYNIDDPQGRYAHIVGNGDSNTDELASNAHTIDWQGNAWFAGDVYVGGSSQDDGKRLATEEYVNSKASGSCLPETVPENDGMIVQQRNGEWTSTSLSQALSYNYASPVIMGKYDTQFFFDADCLKAFTSGSTSPSFAIHAANGYYENTLYSNLEEGNLTFYHKDQMSGKGNTKTLAFIEDIDEKLGAIDSVLDAILAKQNAVLGGNS